MTSKYLISLACVLLFAILVAMYWPGLHGGFFFDDGPSILLAEGIRITSLTPEAIYQAWASGGAGPSGRPIAQLSFALNYFFSGFNPFAFKATNLAIHLACGFLIFGLARRILTASMPQVQPRDTLVAVGVVTALWLLHPIQLLPVLHVVQRMTSLSGLFLLAALLLHISARERVGRPDILKLIFAWGLLWPLSFLSKETGGIFPLFALAWELIIRRSTSGGLDKFARGLAVVVGFSLLIATVYALSSRGQWLWAGYELRNFSLTDRLLTEGRVLWFYLRLMAFPQLELFGLYHDDFPLSNGLFTPWTTLPSIAGLIGLMGLAWKTRARAPLVSFGIAWFFIGHSLESTILPLEIAHEHRNYLPLLGVLWVGAWVLSNALQRKDTYKTMGIALASVFCVYVAFVTAMRSHQFGDEGRRTQIEAEHHRTSSRAQHEAGIYMAKQDDATSASKPAYYFAHAHYKLACELDPNSKMCWLGLIHLNCKAGIPVDATWIQELAHRLQNTPFAPGDRTVLYNLKEMSIAGQICLSRPQIEHLFAAALANSGVSSGVQAMLHSWHADYLWLREHDMAAARSALGKSLTLNPYNPSNRLKWAQLLFISGERDKARQLLLELQSLNFSTDERKTLNELLATYHIVAN